MAKPASLGKMPDKASCWCMVMGETHSSMKRVSKEGGLSCHGNTLLLVAGCPGVSAWAKADKG